MKGLIRPPMTKTFDLGERASAIALERLQVKICSGIPAILVQSSSQVVPESMKMVVFGLIRSMAFLATTSLEAALRILLSGFTCNPSAPTTYSTDRAPPCMRMILRSWSRLLRSVRSVMSETSGKAFLIWANETLPLRLINSVMALRRSAISMERAPLQSSRARCPHIVLSTASIHRLRQFTPHILENLICNY